MIGLGRVAYATAFVVQCEHHARVVAAREAGSPVVGVVLLVEHDPPVITVSRRPEARGHLLASAEALRRDGIEVCETDRGGDITYHGPGQLVAYPIFDLNTLGMNLHAYMRFLEQAVIDTCAAFGVATMRDPSATGVWTIDPSGQPAAKIAALGVRVRRWVTMHGLALNVTTNLAHFDHIVPCGLAGREVTSLRRELGDKCPSIEGVKMGLTARLRSSAAESAARSAVRPR